MTSGLRGDAWCHWSPFCCGWSSSVMLMLDCGVMCASAKTHCDEDVWFDAGDLCCHQMPVLLAREVSCVQNLQRDKDPPQQTVSLLFQCQTQNCHLLVRIKTEICFSLSTYSLYTYRGSSCIIFTCVTANMT